MRKIFITCLTWLDAFGLQPLKSFYSLKNLPVIVKEYFLLKNQNTNLDNRWKVNFLSPNFNDKRDTGGVASGHYFHQDLLVARKIYERKPDNHIDVGSRIDGFIAHLAVFREVEVFDIRPVSQSIKNIKFVQKDIMEFDESLSNYCDSLSCLHALEHFGLGRYGDKIDVTGYSKGFEVLSKMIKPLGILYLSVPIGRERVEFNGQRVFSINRVFDLFRNEFELIAFSYVDDNGDLHEDIPFQENYFDNDLDLEYGCGIFELKKFDNN